MEKIRLDKYLAQMAIGSRKEVKALVRRGVVMVNGKAADVPDQKVEVGKDRVEINGTCISFVEYEYYILHKPVGYVSATRDDLHPTVMELVPEKRRQDLFPVGRLDIDTEGLLLITNDGKLASRLLSPKHHVDKWYFVKVEGKLTGEDVEAFANGMDIGDDTPTAPALLEILSPGEVSEARVKLTEGRYHQIKRMFAAINKPVLYLKRTAMGPLVLEEELKLGECRSLTEEEVERLKKTGQENRKEERNAGEARN